MTETSTANNEAPAYRANELLYARESSGSYSWRSIGERSFKSKRRFEAFMAGIDLPASATARPEEDCYELRGDTLFIYHFER